MPQVPLTAYIIHPIARWHTQYDKQRRGGRQLGDVTRGELKERAYHKPTDNKYHANKIPRWLWQNKSIVILLLRARQNGNAASKGMTAISWNNKIVKALLTMRGGSAFFHPITATQTPWWQRQAKPMTKLFDSRISKNTTIAASAPRPWQSPAAA